MVNDNTFKITVILAILCIGLGGILAVVAIFGDDPALSRIVQYFATAVPVIIGFAFITNKQVKNDQATDETKKGVSYLAGSLNGKLDARFQEILDAVQSAPAPATTDQEPDNE